MVSSVQFCSTQRKYVIADRPAKAFNRSGGAARRICPCWPCSELWNTKAKMDPFCVPSSPVKISLSPPRTRHITVQIGSKSHCGTTFSGDQIGCRSHIPNDSTFLVLQEQDAFFRFTLLHLHFLFSFAGLRLRYRR